MSLHYDVITSLQFGIMMSLCYDIVTLLYDMITLLCHYITLWDQYILL